MDRRENLKLLIAGSIGAGYLLTTGCTPKGEDPKNLKLVFDYGRTEEEKLHDAKLMEETFFTERERKMIDILVDIIIPKDEISCSATEAGVPDFIDFMMRDYPKFQVTMRGGLMWLNARSLDSYNKEFTACSEEERMTIIDRIAFPDQALPEDGQGVAFFNQLRNLTATGFFTSKQGIADLGYVGNRPNEWDGVPEEVLQKHGLSYDARTLEVCLKKEERNMIANWDAEGNLIRS